MEAQLAIHNTYGDFATNDSTLQPFTWTSMKLDMPRFDGSEPLAWIFKIKQFFDYHRTPEDQRLQMVGFFMEGEALTWFQWIHDNKLISTWRNFLPSLTSHQHQHFLHHINQKIRYKISNATLEYNFKWENIKNENLCKITIKLRNNY